MLTDEQRLRHLSVLEANHRDKRHGTSTGYRYGCRCLRCCLQHSRYQEDYKRRKR